MNASDFLLLEFNLYSLKGGDALSQNCPKGGGWGVGIQFFFNKERDRDGVGWCNKEGGRRG